jgi:uncharacterized protein
MTVLPPKIVMQLLLLLIVVVLNLDGIWGAALLVRIAGIVFLLSVILLRSWEVLHLAVLFLFMGISSFILSLLGINYYSVQFLPIALFFMSTAIIACFKPARMTLSWVRIGTLDRVALFWLSLTSILSVAALLLWAWQADFLGMGAQLTKGFATYPRWLILGPGIPFFALVNALNEEVIYRGVLQEALLRVFKKTLLVLILQASAFSAAHYAMGFPNGPIGYGMVFVWGVMLGYLRIRTNGMLAPYVAHVVADLTIGYYLCLNIL